MFCTVGGSRRTRRKPMQTQGEQSLRKEPVTFSLWLWGKSPDHCASVSACCLFVCYFLSFSSLNGKQEDSVTKNWQRKLILNSRLPVCTVAVQMLRLQPHLSLHRFSLSQAAQNKMHFDMACFAHWTNPKKAAQACLAHQYPKREITPCCFFLSAGFILGELCVLQVALIVEVIVFINGKITIWPSCKF